jgi:hypothetical protein
MTITKQLIYTSKMVKNNPSRDMFSSVVELPSCPDEIENNKHSMLSTCYPTCRPLKIYRKQGITSNILNETLSSCNEDCYTNKQIGLPFKLLGKKENGESKMCCTNTQGPTDTNNISTVVRNMKGTLSSFGGGAKIASSVQPTNYLLNNNNSPYYSEYLSYIRGRGNTFMAKSTLKKIQGIDYANPLASEYYETTEGIPCNPNVKTFYKPNNKKFACQGSVSSSTRLQNLKLNTINVNNSSFQSTFNVNLKYQSEPVYFEKNKVNKCTSCYNTRVKR